MSEFVKVGTVDEIPLGQMKGFLIGRRKVVVVHSTDGFFALDNECTHDSAPISTGYVHEHEIQCPRHGARFDPRTGAVTAPPAVVPIDCHELKLDGNDIFVKLED